MRGLQGRCVLREPVLRKSKEVTDLQEEGTVTWGILLRRNYDVLSVKWGGLQGAEGGVRTVSLAETRAQVLRGDLRGGDDVKRDDNTHSNHTVRAQRGTSTVLGTQMLSTLAEKGLPGRIPPLSTPFCTSPHPADG